MAVVQNASSPKAHKIVPFWARMYSEWSLLYKDRQNYPHIEDGQFPEAGSSLNTKTATLESACLSLHTSTTRCNKTVVKKLSARKPRLKKKPRLMQQKKRPGMERLGGPAPLETLQEVPQACQHKFSRRCCTFIQPPSVKHHSTRFVPLIAFRQLHPNAGLRLPEQKAWACCCRMLCFAHVLARSMKRITRLLHAFRSIGPHEAS